MKYETPKLTALTPAINAIETASNKTPHTTEDNGVLDEGISAYADWE